MYLLTFEPLTGALTMFAFQNLCLTPPRRVIPRARVMLRRHWDVFADAAVSELSDPVVDALAVEPVLYVMVTAMVAAMVAAAVWRLAASRWRGPPAPSVL